MRKKGVSVYSYQITPEGRRDVAWWAFACVWREVMKADDRLGRILARFL